jgi:hypothetical protein
MIYEIIFYVGPEIKLKTKGRSGTLIWLEDAMIFSESPTQTYKLPFSSILSVDMFWLHGLGRFIKLICVDNSIIFLTVSRLNIAGYFVVINSLKVSELYRKLKRQISNNIPSPL